MKIQIITQNKIKESSNMKINSFANPESLDAYDINIFDLTGNFWTYDDNRITTVNSFKDIKHIKNIIMTANNKKNILVLPQNSEFRYDYSSVGYTGIKDYQRSENLKNCFYTISNIIKDNFIDYNCSLGYEKNKTTISNYDYDSDFYIIEKNQTQNTIINKSNKSNKITSLKISDNLIITTLDIFKEDLLSNYLASLKFTESESCIPDWVSEIDILNDKELKKEKAKKEKEIINIQEDLKRLKLSIDKNNEYKAILYETGIKLSTKVNEILAEIFNMNFENFNDVYEEDFLLKLTDITFVVEIKGVIHNVKGTNISEAYNHVQVYLDDVYEKENVKGILIIANQRLINPKDRININERQIKIAKRNEMLIIKTEDLLTIYEQYMNKTLTTDEIKKLFKENIGLLNLNENNKK